MPKAKINSIQIHYEIYGSGEPIVFLNGVLMSIQSWNSQISFFEKDYSCIMHDMRGQLQSDKPDEVYSMELHADDLLKLLDYLKIKQCHIVGTSYGGEVGMVFAYTYPERVKSLTIIASVSYVEPLLKEQVEIWVKLANLDRELFYRVLATNSYSNKYLSENKQLIESGINKFKLLPDNFFKGFSRLVDAFTKLNYTSELSRIVCSTLVVCCEQDAVKPCHYSKTIQNEIKNSKLVVIPEAGHAVVIEKPELINSILLEFIKGI